jgi:LPPG:FO 2-phospho-L-lactate transferase
VSPQLREKIVVLAGGVGAAKLLKGLVKVIDPTNIVAIVNVADDTTLHGLRICPDLDTVTYTLAGEINPETGWGLKDEGWKAMEMLNRYDDIDWFRLGDRDLGTHLFRTHRLLQGAPLSIVTAEIAASWKIGVTILPVSDDPINTFVNTLDLGEIGFQDYFVRHQHNIQVTGVRFEGIDTALPGPDVLDALQYASGIIIAPSNPIVSIGPILAIPGITEALKARKDNVVAVSGIINGKALKGPAARLLHELGHEISPVGVARIYSEIVGNFVLDTVDAHHIPSIEKLGIACVATDTVMLDPTESANLCSTLLSLCLSKTST